MVGSGDGSRDPAVGTCDLAAVPADHLGVSGSGIPGVSADIVADAREALRSKIFASAAREEHSRDYGDLDENGQVLLSRRMWLTMQVMVRGASWFDAVEAVSSTAIEHPEWDLAEMRTFQGWSQDTAAGGLR